MTSKLSYLSVFLLLLILRFYSASAQNKIDIERENYQQEFLTIESLPSNLPSRFSIPISYLGDVMTLDLEKSSVYGKNTRFLIDDGTGKLVETEKPKECTYTGSVRGGSGAYVNAVISDDGLIATIVKSKSETIEIRPLSDDKKIHKIFTIKNENSDLGEKSLFGIDDQSFSMTKSESPIANTKSTTHFSSIQNKQLSIQNNNLGSATLAPTTVMDVIEFEIGVEIGSRSFFGSAYNGVLATAQASAQSLAVNLNKRFLHGSGVKFILGTVIIRTDASTDPLRDLVTATGTKTNALSSLRAFRDYWNNNPNVVGNTHAVAVYHVKAGPSGLSYVNSVATSSRYATLGGNGATSWANGTAAHEIGHSFHLHHTGESGLFYENRPRVDAGATTAGGRDFYISAMHGSGNNNIGRFSTSEAKVVRQVLNAKRSAGTPTSTPGEVKPFGVYDEYEYLSLDPIVLDVVANDYDMNNDVLDVEILDQVSNLGGTISLSAGTGPGGRNELIYTPPASGLTGRDFFHYTVFDTTGRKDFGAVYVDSGISLFDENSDEFRFDFGKRGSNLFAGYDRVSENTSNSLYGWLETTGVTSRDRGDGNGANDLNRDLCTSSDGNPKVFETTLRNGTWRVVVTLGDVFDHDNLFVKAEGVDKVENFTITPNVYTSETFDVDVLDGKLSLEFSSRGGSDVNWVVNRVVLTYMGVISAINNILEDGFAVYPNPANSVLNIKTTDYTDWTLSIVNTTGNTMYSNSKNKSLSGEEMTVNVDGWSQGVYFVIFNVDNKNIVKKIIVN